MFFIQAVVLGSVMQFKVGQPHRSRERAISWSFQLPDAVCLLAPGNDLTASRTIQVAVDELVNVVSTRWPKACFYL